MFEFQKQNGEQTLVLRKWEEKMLKAKKIRVKVKCHFCKASIPKGSWAFGERYTKICVKCEKSQVFPRITNGAKNILARIEKLEKEFELNLEKYERDNTLANLQDG